MLVASLETLPFSSFMLPDLLDIHSYNDTTRIPFTAFGLAQDTLAFSNQKMKSQAAEREDLQRFPADPNKQPGLLSTLSMEELTRCSSPQEVAFVHVGGGNGALCVELVKCLPNLVGKVINQFEDAAEPRLEHSMVEHREIVREKQVILAAKVYYLDGYLTPRADDSCLSVLELTRDAMSLESVLVIHETMIKTTYLEWEACGQDLIIGMMSGARIRTVSEYEAMFAKSGLKIGSWTQHSSGTGDFYVVLRKNGSWEPTPE